MVDWYDVVKQTKHTGKAQSYFALYVCVCMYICNYVCLYVGMYVVYIGGDGKGRDTVLLSNPH